MDFPGDLLLDRKRLKSQLITWRTIAILAVFGVSALYFGHFSKHPATAVTGDYIAQLNIDGVMVDSTERDELIKEIKDDKSAKALIVRMDSPGGTALAGEELELQLREIAQKKPVVVVMRTLCASACYMAAIGADQIFAREGTLTGSIGVLMQSLEISRLADKLGVTPITIKSGKYKDAPSIAEPFTADERAVVSQVVMDAYDHFVRLIVERRKMDDVHVRALADGRVYTGHQAVGLRLVDALGGDAEAIDWLAKNRKINPKLEVKEIKPERQIKSLLQVLSQWSGMHIFDNASTVGLDGLLSIWHPSLVQ